MSDFAKNLFGFGGFHKKYNQGNDTHEENKDACREGVGGKQIVYGKENFSDMNNKIMPKGLLQVAPTTAISDNSLAYGTTTKNNSAKATSEAFLNQKYKKPGPNVVNSDGQTVSFAGTRIVDKNDHHYNEGYQISESTVNMTDESSANTSLRQSSSTIQPLIVTTDETGQNINSKSSTQPKGKLKVNILEARSLLINSANAQPYVVCTYESSEYVTSTPGSFNKSSGASNNYLGYDHKIPGREPTCSLPVAKGKNTRAPHFQRQSSSRNLQQQNVGSANPLWNHEAIFDVVGSNSELDISVYDAASDDAFLGHVRIFPSTIASTANKKTSSEWLHLKPRVVGERVGGAIKVSWMYSTLEKKLCGTDDFEVLRLLGKGTFGQVFLVRKKDTDRIYAMKVLSKKMIVKKKEIAHTIGERNILVRTSAAQSSFIVGLKFSFQTPTDLYLVTDYMSGGELFWHLQREGRFTEDRAKFYIAELVLALEHLHDNDIVYRDLKPENILLDANGHIALCDFGLSKANLNNDGTTNTFCGTTEYLAPEVLLDESGYTKMVDFWSLGVLIFEMCCGWSPFYADNTQQMYKNIAFGKVRFPKEVLSPEGRSFVKGLLNRNPKHRLGATDDAKELRAHPFFHDIDWDLLKTKSIPPPFKPHITSETDTSNFDPEFTSESTSVFKKQLELASTPLSPGVQANFKGFTYVDDSAIEDHFGRSQRISTYKEPGSFIPGDPNLPPDEDAIDDDVEEEDGMQIDDDDDVHNMDDAFVSGVFDL